jgi:hypothetical protein
MKKVWVSPIINIENLTKTLSGTSLSTVEAVNEWCS